MCKACRWSLHLVGQSTADQGQATCVCPWRRVEDRDLRYRKSEAHILQVRAGWSLDRKSVAKRGDAHALCCAVRRNKVGLYATRKTNNLEADGGNGQGISAGSWNPQQMPLSRG